MASVTGVKRGHVKKPPFFDYSQIDNENVKLLKQKAKKLSKIDSMRLFDAGKELKEAQDIFAGNKSVSFGEWAGSLGITPKTAYNYINVYCFLVKRVSHIKLLEKLPARVLYQISKPSAEPEIIEAVISGRIKSFKDLKAYESGVVEENGEDISDNEEETHERKLESIITDIAELRKSLSESTTGIEKSEKLLSALELLNSEITSFRELLLSRVRRDEEKKEISKSGIQLLFDVYTKNERGI